MTVDEEMENKHGSRMAALRAGIAAEMTNSDMGREYHCSPNFIARKLKEAGIKNPIDGRKRVQPTADSPTMGTTGTVARKEMTASCLRGAELSRGILLAQVTHYEPGTTAFNAAACEILARRGA